MTKSLKISLTVLVIALIALGAIKIGKSAGQHRADQDLERVQLIWPGVLSMPDADRAFLVGLAITCDLYKSPVERGAVIDCLRSAANNPNPTLPVGFDKAAAPEKFESMLKAASK